MTKPLLSMNCGILVKKQNSQPVTVLSIYPGQPHEGLGDETVHNGYELG